ncbi:hypothetical protein M3650_09640 [Paenibacillus sp. MER TA 81-3]|uniref:hypothetical protein n=1 Tax=Paenibacillus sp. MER TA 81-3 TaxID=2939573 RepID=UPI0020418640|nr:hypothetical protein [Paenibacillus sp. MER TA 81-3]MCM3338883.1 hypothetical protein [Paenibacillus sp. MER TA 81-3]
MKKKIFTILFIFCTFLLLFGCSGNTKFMGKTENWEVTIIQRGNLEQLQYEVKYVGNEQSIKDFKYQFESKTLNSSGTIGEPASTPFKLISNTRVIGQRKIEEPIKLTINWNGKQETGELKVH